MDKATGWEGTRSADSLWAKVPYGVTEDRVRYTWAHREETELP
jgi:hypothetical protein